MEQEWIYALIGGGLIGLAATVLLLSNGRITGISGIMFGILKPQKNDTLWKIKFLIGLLIGGAIASSFLENPFTNTTGRSMIVIGLAGLLVGFGTRLGSGCTSGHGICGISRASRRSLAATISFMFAGMLSVVIVSKFFGGF